ncbi:ADP-ribosyl-[dinitrogen reductase] hydrolase [Natrinema hispanicum]|uniref:ADP-ribosyl-[dinitrogen reductase] hydrolase n=1 Tax=Natrinema hispanicum TaxID=392421 RepID=A0A482YI15_9EURY|nr:ADP-ribosylglycohydrolase family protein [Natrinema hispanicum]RZV12561.1 ADP-ribosyl-[dinitrogen reductase] hydrolase [Natrinema hispanicum]
MVTADAATGVMLGLACGDSLGRPVEFKSAREIEHEHGTLTEMVGNGTWGQPAGTITDDTDQALCIARSVVEQSQFDPAGIARRFVDWYDTDPFDIGVMTRRSLQNLKQGYSWDEAGQAVWEASPEGSNAGNGSVMRCPPLAIAYATDLDSLVTVSRDSSQITHADPRCTYGCAVLNLTIAGYLCGEDQPLAMALDQVRSDAPNELVTALEPLVAGKAPDPLSTSGYVIHTLQTALHDAIQADSSEDAIVTAVNRGGDTDTIGAIAGAVAGARFGASELPDRWLAEIDEEAELRHLATALQNLGGD